MHAALKHHREVQMRRSIFIAGLLISTLAASSGHAVEPRPSVETLRQTLSVAMEAYSTCALKSADALIGQLEETPESIADKSHESCLGQFGKATDAAILYTVTVTPKSGALSAITFASRQIEEYRAVVRNAVIAVVTRTRNGDAARQPAETGTLGVP